MKKPSKILFVICPMLFVGAGCEESNNSVDVTQEQLIGNWLEINPCDSCAIFSFTGEGKILETSTLIDQELMYSYQLLSSNRIEVTREWVIEDEKKTTQHPLNFINADTLELIQLRAMDAVVTGFSDVTLYKISQ